MYKRITYVCNTQCPCPCAIFLTQSDQGIPSTKESPSGIKDSPVNLNGHLDSTNDL